MPCGKFFCWKKSSVLPQVLQQQAPMPEPEIMLHGRLAIHVVEARDVEGPAANFFSKLERAVTSSVDGVDPYVSVKVSYNKVMQTRVIQNSTCPVWDAQATFPVAHAVSAVEFRVKAAKRSGPLGIISKVKHLSMLSIPAEDLLRDRTVAGWFPLTPYQSEYDPANGDDATDSDSDTDSEHGHHHAAPSEGSFGDIHVSVVYTPIEEMATDELAHIEAPHIYFPLREGVHVNMYQDADCPPGSVAEIPFRPDYQHGRCWIDVANAIMSSTQFIYITGWAVWPELVMVRTDYPGDQWQGMTLGEMLKQKAEEGVNVCVMVWDEYASGKFFKGIMGTHDEEVVAYFRKSKVNAIKVGRENPSSGPFADLNDAVMFTHHQKTIIVSKLDEELGRHRLEAFVGGLDLTDGRYDNNDHSLFRTLDNIHAAPDFWQACTVASAESGPREPWHDIHSHITGSPAWDVLENFEGRWLRQASGSKKELLHPHPEDVFVQEHEEADIQDGSWNVQVLRSINESSTALANNRDGLIKRRAARTDQSIHNAYVHHIRTARHFIYIENQYFLGSSHLWESGQRGGFAANLVPIEIAEKICAKIRANERFAVYVSVPMYPEGAPESGAVQEILSHQRKTVGLITRRIAAAIQETGSETSITDWFNVFCLVNRESEEDSKGNGGVTEKEMQLSQSRRFMIYIHSKFAIFDDTVAIIGSANINSRSLDGSRDTEIAVSAWQPEFVATGPSGYGGGLEEEPSLPQGDVAAFRASVWSEHFRGYVEEFENPASSECVSKVRELADANWQHFASDEEGAGGEMPHGHWALYPYEFDEETGEVRTRQVMFPDFGTALIKGKATPGIPNMLTG